MLPRVCAAHHRRVSSSDAPGVLRAMWAARVHRGQLQAVLSETRRVCDQRLPQPQLVQHLLGVHAEQEQQPRDCHGGHLFFYLVYD